MRTALLLLTLTAAAVAQPPSAPGEKGSIEGVVINQVTNAPIKKAQVNVAGMQAVTDVSGHFVVAQLAAGTYEVSAFHPSFPPAMLSSPGAHVRITLEPGEHKKDISIALMPGVAISGTILDEDGDILPGCFVQVMQFKYQAGKKELRPVRGDPANDRGEYRISDLASGRFYLMAMCRHQVLTARPFAAKDAILDLPEETYADQFYPGSSDVSGATKLTPPPGAELRDLDFRMRKVRAVSIRGKVLRPTGEDASQFLDVSVSPKSLSDNGRTRRGPVKPSGDFEIHGVLPGSYWLVAHNYDQGSPFFGRIDLDVGDSSINEVVLPMSPGVTLSGIVETESPPSGQAPSPEPAPVKSATQRIWLFLLDAVNRFQRLSAEVKDDGEFSISGLTPGDWGLNYQPMPPGTYIKSVRFGDQEVSPERFTIGQGAVGSLKIVIGANPGEIEGTVQLDSPQSSGNISVMLLPDSVSRQVFQPNLQTIADAVGHFSFQRVAPGKYRLCALEGGSHLQQLPDFTNLLKSLGVEVTVEEGGHVTKQLKPISASAVADALKEIE